MKKEGVNRDYNLCDSTTLVDCATDRCPVWKARKGTCHVMQEYQTKDYNGHWELLQAIKDKAKSIIFYSKGE